MFADKKTAPQAPQLKPVQSLLGLTGSSCRFCETAGCDVQILPCRCCLHARCCPVSEGKTLTACPICKLRLQSLQLLPMTFDEIDNAKRQAELTEVSDKRGRKRKNKTIARLTGRLDEPTGRSAADELRTGRWTTEETEYCDSLIVFFEQGALPIPSGLKLNEFLSNMLKSKQSRLTKKMKNAGLSARQYKVITGHITSQDDARAFSQLEHNFFSSIPCRMERAEIRFHMQKEWRELFSNYCLSISQPIDANPWLYSVEELDRRVALQRDAERMTRRKIMMGQALDTDGPDSRRRGVYIEPSAPAGGDQEDEEPNSMRHYASPFVAKIMEVMQKHRFPFEHVDVWVPSYVQPGSPNTVDDQNCRLCFAGCGTTDRKIAANRSGEWVPMTDDEQFQLLSFGEYSQKFSFQVNCGLPGRVYQSGVASWEQGIQNAPLAKFERCGGARQWGINTVLGVPIPSPSVGRIVVVFYSICDRSRSLLLVNRIAEDLSQLRPSPKWKLVVDIGSGIPKTADATEEERKMQNYLLGLLDKFTPSDKSAPRADFLPGFTSLRLLLIRRHRSSRENDLIKSTLVCFQAYRKAGRSELDSVAMTARDFMALSKSTTEAGVFAKPEGQQTVCQSQVDGVASVATTTTFNGSGSDGISRSKFVPQSNTTTIGKTENKNSISTISYPERSANQNAAGALASLGGSPLLSSLGTLGSSPALNPISSQEVVAPFGLSAAQFSALLQNFSNEQTNGAHLPST